MKKTGSLLYTMFFFLQKVFCSTKIQKNIRKTNCQLFILFFVPLAHHRFSSHTTSSRGSVMIFLRSYHTLDEAEMCRSLWPEMA